MQARIKAAEQKYLDGADLSASERRIIAMSLHVGGCHACGFEDR
jgi:hypothetical protein